MGTGLGRFSSAEPNVAYANPSHYPGARFDIPTATTQQGYEFPAFGGVTNLAEGKVSLPPLGSTGTMSSSSQYKMPTFGRFDPTVPKTSFQMGGITRKPTPRFYYPRQQRQQQQQQPQQQPQSPFYGNQMMQQNLFNEWLNAPAGSVPSRFPTGQRNWMPGRFGNQ